MSEKMREEFEVWVEDNLPDDGNYNDSHIGVARMAWQSAITAAEAAQPAMTAAATDVLAERRRQVEAEGWKPDHDDAYRHGQLAGAAACYALTSAQHWQASHVIDQLWPWDASWWKPSDKRRDLIKAGALILAEIERLDRAESKQKGGAA